MSFSRCRTGDALTGCASNGPMKGFNETVLEDLESAVSGFLANDALSRGAAIAFYAATSLAPVLLNVVGLVFGQDAARGAISEELGQLLGPTGDDFIKSISNGLAIPSGRAADLLT
jgi:membrane protein